MLKFRETDRANVRVVYSTMVLIVADFFWLSLAVGRQFACREKRPPGHLQSRLVTSNHVHCACQTSQATDRPEIGQSIATVLIASSEVCACAAS
jgi:hypothetical protein